MINSFQQFSENLRVRIISPYTQVHTLTASLGRAILNFIHVSSHAFQQKKPLELMFVRILGLHIETCIFAHQECDQVIVFTFMRSHISQEKLFGLFPKF